MIAFFNMLSPKCFNNVCFIIFLFVFFFSLNRWHLTFKCWIVFGRLFTFMTVYYFKFIFLWLYSAKKNCPRFIVRLLFYSFTQIFGQMKLELMEEKKTHIHNLSNWIVYYLLNKCAEIILIHHYRSCRWSMCIYVGCIFR